MNILLFSRILAKTGVGNHVNQLADFLQRQGHSVTVVSGTQDISLSNPDVEFIRVDTLSRNPIKVWRSIRHLNRIIRDKKIDIVHCHHRVAAIYMFLYNIFFRIPYVYTLHSANIPHDIFHRMLTFPGKCAIGVSSEVSRFMIEKLKIAPEKVVTVLNGVDDAKLTPLTAEEEAEIKEKWNIPRDKMVFVLHSRIDAVKNHLLVVEAVRHLTEEERSRMVVVCSGERVGDYYETVLQTIQQHQLEDCFRFVGWVDAREFLGIADFLLMPSINEGFGLNVAEAFLMKVPAARTQTAGYEDLKYCLPIDAVDPAPTVALIRDVVHNGMGSYGQRIEDAYAFAKATLTADQMARNTVKIYEKVCN